MQTNINELAKIFKIYTGFLQIIKTYSKHPLMATKNPEY